MARSRKAFEASRPRSLRRALANRDDRFTRPIHRSGPASPIGPAGRGGPALPIVPRGEPTHVDALHLLGVACHELGQSEAAARLIGLAVAARPQAAVFCATLAEAYRVLGRYDVVIECCQAAIGLGLSDAAVHNNLGLASRAGPAW